MARIALPLFLLALLLAACGGDETPAQARTQADLARLVFTALQSGDFGLQAEAIPAAEDIEWTLDQVAANAPSEAEKSRERLLEAGGAAAIAEQGRARAEQAFTRTFELSSQAFDWKTATLRGVDLDRTKAEETYGFQAADIWFGVKAGEKTYEFLLSKCVETPKGWLVAGGVHFHPEDPSALIGMKSRMLLAHMQRIGQSLKLYRMIHKSLPETLAALTEPDAHSGEPLLKTAPIDPWNNELAYEVLGEKAFRLTSSGPDGEAGTSDDISWPE